MQKHKRRTIYRRISQVAAALLAATVIAAEGGQKPAEALGLQASPAVLYAQIQANNAAEVVKLVNEQRGKAGLKPLIVHTNLTKLAKAKSIDMYQNKYFSHDSPKFGSPFDMMDKYNITFEYAGENLAKGQRSAAQVVKDWMASPGHRANILNPKYTLIGVGYYNGYWSEEFIGKDK